MCIRDRLKQCVQLDKLQPRLHKNFGPRNNGKSALKNAVGAGIAVMHRVTQQPSATVQQAKVDVYKRQLLRQLPGLAANVIQVERS